MIDRNRQALAGHNEAMLSQSTVLLFGAGPVAELTTVGLTAMGIQTNLVQPLFPLDEPPCLFVEGSASDIAAFTRELTKCDSVRAWSPDALNLLIRQTRRASTQTPIIIDATGAQAHAKKTWDIARQLNGPWLATRVDEDGRGFQLLIREREEVNGEAHLDIMANASGGNPHGGIAFIIAGLIANEVRRIACPLETDAIPVPTLSFSLPADASFGHSPITSRQGSAVLMGVGGIGAQAAIALSHHLSALLAFDADSTEASNRSRAPFLREGLKKVESILPYMGKGLRFIGISEDAESLERVVSLLDDHAMACPDVVISVTDTWSSRAFASELTKTIARAQTPAHLNAGCTPTEASAFLAGPAHGLACFTHRVQGLTKLIAEEQRASCSATPLPSVLATNWIAAGFVAVLAERACQGSFSQSLQFSSNHPARFVFGTAFGACACAQKPRRIDILPIP